MTPKSTSVRKDEHLRINLEEDVSFVDRSTGLERYHLVHQALPEVNLEDVDTTTVFLGHHLSMPLLISSMTGGTEEAGRLNRTLAEVAQEAGIGMGLGSTRAMIEHPETAKTFKVRSFAPDILLLANLGAVQLQYGYGLETCRRLVAETEADGLYLHLNPLQEALQPEGNTRFAGLLRKIEMLCRSLEVPVIVKEVGWGLSARVARQLIDAGVAALDVAGAGGTSWSQVEFHRLLSADDREIAASFRNWGIPTALSIQMVRQVDRSIPLVASGGLRTGLDIAKCLALGADLAGMAGVLLRAAAESKAALSRRLRIIRRQLRIVMFVTGSRDIPALQQAQVIED
ncbi:MAG TPA: type 2 isopentenyl-diphosphate Delta-isomerase, partial [Chloroflexi bacterium]|nr:type 2 isopentenyl-diphosphate Delta-isomerase [Chloroflexota bacterium]